jgi:hypothetical protein
MNEEESLKILKTSWKSHSQVETSYLNNQAILGGDEWLEKQRSLLSAMALHLLQTPISPRKIELDKLRNNRHARLTITDQFLPKVI